ncbi:YchJ family metal-binding protein [Agromyces mediolanus]|uniref:YchJ family protein n=1 Tax=Agromyces mediolanus TaxID=41986 RepID=UPI00383646F1
MPDQAPLRPSPNAPCPCGGGEYAACCGPALDGATPPPTAAALMRSRYTAFALSDTRYLLESWAAATRPRELSLDPGTDWRRLVVIDVVDGGADDPTGIVEFRAVFRDADGRGELHERSRFVREDGRWRYLDGAHRD